MGELVPQGISVIVNFAVTMEQKQFITTRLDYRIKYQVLNSRFYIP